MVLGQRGISVGRFALIFLFGLATGGVLALEADVIRLAAFGFCTSGHTTGLDASFAAMRSPSAVGDTSFGAENNRAVSILGASITGFSISIF